MLSLFLVDLMFSFVYAKVYMLFFGKSFVVKHPKIESMESLKLLMYKGAQCSIRKIWQELFLTVICI